MKLNNIIILILHIKNFKRFNFFRYTAEKICKTIISEHLAATNQMIEENIAPKINPVREDATVRPILNLYCGFSSDKTKSFIILFILNYIFFLFSPTFIYLIIRY